MPTSHEMLFFLFFSSHSKTSFRNLQNNFKAYVPAWPLIGDAQTSYQTLFTTPRSHTHRRHANSHPPATQEKKAAANWELAFHKTIGATQSVQEGVLLYSASTESEDLWQREIEVNFLNLIKSTQKIQQQMEYLLVKCWNVSPWNWKQSKDVCNLTRTGHCTKGPGQCKKTRIRRSDKDWVGMRTVVIQTTCLCLQINC